MTKPKAQTLQQRFGFQDGDLRTPQHDEIMLWLEEHIEKVITTLYPDVEGLRIDGVHWEVPVLHGKFILGFVDMFVWFSQTSHDHNIPMNICFEVKSKIDSLGELFRQLRMYQGRVLDNTSYSTVGVICVVSPDERLSYAIERQGFKFFHYTVKEG